MNTINGFIGTYTASNSKGIYSFTIIDDKIDNISLAYEIDNPTYLVKSHHYLFSTCSSTIENELYGGISSFKITKDNKLTPISSKLLKGKPPCHIYVNNLTSNIISSNYHKNEILSYPIMDGSILDITSSSQHIYNGDFITPQEKPHIHYGELSKNKNLFYSLDLGTDSLFIHKVNEKSLSNLPIKEYKFKKGTGPRHMITLNDDNYSFVLSELSGEVFSLEINDENIKLISTLQLVENTNITPSGSAIRLHPSKRFIYCSERGENKLHLIYINNGFIKKINSYSTFGDGPRDFNISTDGNYLVCGNQLSNNISLYRINNENGFLTFIDSYEAPSPVSIEFI